MHPTLFKIGNISIYSYGVMLAVGFIVATLLSTREAERRSINKEMVVDFAFMMIVSGLLGARLFYVISNWNYFSSFPLEIFMLNRGGLVWYGGLIAATIALFILSGIKKVNFLTIADIFVPYVALAQAFGRIGCFMRGCCYGKEVHSWGVYYPEHRAILCPTQIISALLLVIIFIILRYSSKRIRFPGGVFSLYLTLYSIKRFIVEFLRGDSPIVFSGLTSFQLISIVIFILSLALFFYARKRFRNI